MTTSFGENVITCEICISAGFFWNGNQCWKRCVGNCVGSCEKGALSHTSRATVQSLVTNAPSSSKRRTFQPTPSPTSPSEGFQMTLILLIGVGFFVVGLVVKALASIPKLAVNEACLPEGMNNQSAKPYYGLFDRGFDDRGLNNHNLWRISEGEEIYTSMTSEGRSILETGRSVFSELMSKYGKSARNKPSIQDSPYYLSSRHFFNT